MKRQFLGLLARVYVMQFAMEVPATVAMLAEMLIEYGFQVDIGTVRPLLRALQMEGYLESVLRDGIGRVYQLTEQGREELATSRFTTKMPQGRLEPAEGEATLCAVYAETDDKTGLAKHVGPLRLGGRLAEAWPL